MIVKFLFAQLLLVGCFGFTLFLNEAIGAAFKRDRDPGLPIQALVAGGLLVLLGLGAGAGLFGSIAILLE